MIPFNDDIRARLCNIAKTELRNKHDLAWDFISKPAMKARSTWEPIFVSRLCTGITAMADGWAGVLPSIHPDLRISISSVFTHMTPKATWGKKSGPSCELADLMVVVIDGSEPDEAPIGRAILLQAKQADVATVSLTTTSELNQFHLLSRRPKFSVKSASLAPKDISFPTGLVDDTLLYATNPPASNPPVPKHPWSPTRWFIKDKLRRLKTSKIVPTYTLEAALVELLEGSRGWAFDLSPPGCQWTYFSGKKQEWSELVNYILETTYDLDMTPLQASRDRKKRGHITPVFQLSEEPESWSSFATLAGQFGEQKSINGHWGLVNQQNIEGLRGKKAKDIFSAKLGSGDTDGGDPNEPFNSDDGVWGDGPMSCVVIEVSMAIRKD